MDRWTVPVELRPYVSPRLVLPPYVRLHLSFYTLVGLGNMAFTYNVVLQALSLVGCFITIFFLDKIGRRPFLVVGTFLQVRSPFYRIADVSPVLMARSPS